MHGLKILVSVMSFLLIAGLALFSYGVATSGTSGKKMDTTLALPAGSHINDISIGDNQIAIHLNNKEAEYIYLYSISGDKVTKRIRIENK